MVLFLDVRFSLRHTSALAISQYIAGQYPKQPCFWRFPNQVLEYLDEDSPESIILDSVLEGMAEYYSKNLAREVKLLS